MPSSCGQQSRPLLSRSVCTQAGAAPERSGLGPRWTRSRSRRAPARKPHSGRPGHWQGRGLSINQQFSATLVQALQKQDHAAQPCCRHLGLRCMTFEADSKALQSKAWQRLAPQFPHHPHSPAAGMRIQEPVRVNCSPDTMLSAWRSSLPEELQAHAARQTCGDQELRVAVAWGQPHGGGIIVLGDAEGHRPRPKVLQSAHCLRVSAPTNSSWEV